MCTWSHTNTPYLGNARRIKNKKGKKNIPKPTPPINPGLFFLFFFRTGICEFSPRRKKSNDQQKQGNTRNTNPAALSSLVSLVVFWKWALMLKALLSGKQTRQLLPTACLLSIYLGTGPVTMRVLMWTGFTPAPSPRPLWSGRRWKLACVAARRRISRRDHREPWCPAARPGTQAEWTTAAARWWDAGPTGTRKGASNAAATGARRATKTRRTRKQREETQTSVRTARSGRRFIHGWPSCTWATVKFACFFSREQDAFPYSLSTRQHFFSLVPVSLLSFIGQKQEIIKTRGHKFYDKGIYCS